MPLRCKIEFEGNTGYLYQSGQLLVGSAVLRTTENVSIQAITVAVTGFAEVRWTERVYGNHNNTQTKEFTAREPCLSWKKVVLGGDDCETFQLYSGQYRYKFQVNLPSCLPSTYAGKKGFIRYEVLVMIRRPWSDDNVFRQPFSVIKKVDLNLSPFYKNPILEEQLKLFWCGLCDTKPLKVQVIIPLSAYACGQKIPYTVSVSNESNVDCHDSSIKLQQIVRTTCKVPYEKTRRTIINIAKKQLGKVFYQSKREFSGYLQLPSSIIPSCQTACNVIEIAYNIQLIFYTNSCHRNFIIAFPITIGTIPLNESLPNYNHVVTEQPTISKSIFAELSNCPITNSKPTPSAPLLTEKVHKESSGPGTFSSIFTSIVGMKPAKISDLSADNIKNAHNMRNAYGWNIDEG